MLEGASELFGRGKNSRDKNEDIAYEAELFQQIGRLQMELECLIKVSAFVSPMNCVSWLITPIDSADTLNQPCPRVARGWPDRVRQSALPRPSGASVPSDQAAIRLSKTRLRGMLLQRRSPNVAEPLDRMQGVGAGSALQPVYGAAWAAMQDMIWGVICPFGARNAANAREI